MTSMKELYECDNIMWACESYFVPYYVFFSLSPPSSTNLTELAKAVRLLAALSPTELTGDELLKAARALAAATAGLLNAAQPENVEVGSN